MSNFAKHTIRKVLIANRGEIALRIKRTLDRLGIEAVLLVSSAESNSFFAKQFESTILVKRDHPKDVFLDIAEILKSARNAGCDAIHPGYGFLSESPIFSKAVTDAGLIFIGPDAASIESVGSKTAARSLAKKLKVPTVPGSQGELSNRELFAFAKRERFPLLIKAAAGGGGRGMRIVRKIEDFAEQLQLARQEAYKFFGSDALFVERYIENPRHVEVQIVGDRFGKILHLGTRDCSSQRRHQKLIEEAPAPNISEKLRTSLHSAAIKIAKAVNYHTVGTAEFLVHGSNYYFLEMNTRLQVEHPVTEMITGLDLIELQIRAASGEPLNLNQRDIKFKGHSIEYRVNSEDYESNFAPDIGTINNIELPRLADSVRYEFGFGAGDKVTPHFDSMIGKIVVHAASRQQALSLSGAVLRRVKVSGIKTTIPFFRWFVAATPFRDSPVSIKYIESNLSPESLEQIRNSTIEDPKHLNSSDGGELIKRYLIKNNFEELNVDVLHRPDGFFEFRPQKKGAKWFVSNGLNYGLDLIKRGKF